MPTRMERHRAAPVPEPVLLAACQRVERLIGLNSLLTVLNESHFEMVDALQMQMPEPVASFVTRQGPFAQWRECHIMLNPDVLQLPERETVKLIAFTLLVSHCWVNAGIAWWPKEPHQLLRTLCAAAGVPYDNRMPDSPTEPEPDEQAEIIHQGPDQ